MNLDWSLGARVRRIADTWLARLSGHPELGQALPDFLVIGAMKAGTTTLFAALNEHPRMLRPRRREIHFFGRKFPRGLQWYRRHFATGKELRQFSAITGEGSTSYLANANVPARIRRVLPNVKMIALLRDPVDRAISNFFHEQRTGRETLGLEEALLAEGERLRRHPLGKQGGMGFLAYRNRGLYAEQLKRYFALFPREQILVLQSEAFFADPQPVFARVCRFLGLEPELAHADFKPRNVGDYDASLVSSSVHDELARYFAPFNRELYDLLGEDFGWRA